MDVPGCNSRGEGLPASTQRALEGAGAPGGYPSTGVHAPAAPPAAPPAGHFPLLRALASLCLRRRAARVQISHRAICLVLEYQAPGTRVPSPLVLEYQAPWYSLVLEYQAPWYSSTKPLGTRVPGAWDSFCWLKASRCAGAWRGPTRRRARRGGRLRAARRPLKQGILFLWIL